jgi:hypothetical protein
MTRQAIGPIEGSTVIDNDLLTKAAILGMTSVAGTALAADILIQAKNVTLWAYHKVRS